MKHRKRYEEFSDEQLVKAANRGDSAAFEKLVGRYEQKIYNLIYRIVKNPEITKDVMQDTFIKVYRALKTFKGESKFSTWLYRVAVNFGLMYLRKQKTTLKTVSLDEPVRSEEEELPKQIPDWSNNPAAEASNEELRVKINEAINNLPGEYRTIIILRDIEGVSNAEAGKILKLGVPAIKSRVHRARLHLKDKLSDYLAPAHTASSGRSNA